MTECQLIVMGASSGGLAAYSTLLRNLPASFNIPIVLAQHLNSSAMLFPELLQKTTKLNVKEAEDKESIQPGYIYTTPPGYHLLIEPTHAFSLSVDDVVHYARPSIDILFETAAAVYGQHLIGVLLTGANEDGAAGLKMIQDMGGIVMVQDPATAVSSVMPLAGLTLTHTPHVYSLETLSQHIMDHVLFGRDQ